MPDSPIKILWDSTLLFVTLINLIYIPFKIGFSVEESGNHWWVDIICDIVPGIVYVIEIPVNLNTAYYSHGILKKSRDSIFRHYLRKGLISDIIIVLSFIIGQFNLKFLSVVVLLRLSKIGLIFRSLEELSVSQQYQMPFELGKLIFLLIFVCHLTSCAWRALAQAEIYFGIDLVEKTWFTEKNLENQSWDTQYIYCFYWSIISLTTIGYGDIVPQNKYEMIFVSMMVLVTTILFGYVISSIQSIFAHMKKKSDDYKQKMALLNRYIRQYNLSTQLSMKVRNYLDAYLKANDKDEYDQTSMILELLNDDLKSQIKRDVYARILMSSNLISQTFPQEVIDALCQVVHTQRCVPGENLLNIGDNCGKLFFVLKGQVQLYFNQGVFLKELSPGNVIAESNFLLQKYMEYNAKSILFTDVAYIEIEEFKQVLRKFPGQYERYQQLRINIELNFRTNSSNVICEACGARHALMNCPLVFFQGNKFRRIVIPPVSRQKSNTRQCYKRRPLKHQGFRMDRKLLQQASLQVQYDEKLIEEGDIDDNLLGRLGFFGVPNIEDEFVDDMKSSYKNGNDSKSFINRSQMENQLRITTYDIEGGEVPIFHMTPRPKKLSNETNPFIKSIKNQKVQPEQPMETLTQLDHLQKEYIQMKKGDSIEGFDVKQEYKHFFPYFNVTRVMSKLNRKKPKLLRTEKHLKQATLRRHLDSIVLSNRKS